MATTSGARKKVLIVEDNELNMKLFHDLLDAHGYATLQTRNGMEALGLARKHRPALILMDIQLPGIDGLEATKRIRASAAAREIPIVAVTSFAMTGDRERLLAAGSNGYIEKPIDPDTIMAQLAAFLGERP